MAAHMAMGYTRCAVLGHRISRLSSRHRPGRVEAQASEAQYEGVCGSADLHQTLALWGSLHQRDWELPSPFLQHHEQLLPRDHNPWELRGPAGLR